MFMPKRKVSGKLDYDCPSSFLAVESNPISVAPGMQNSEPIRKSKLKAL